MAITYQTIDTLPVQGEMTENTYLLCSESGTTKKIPANAVGGAGGIKTAIIKDSNYDNMLAGLQTAASLDPPAVTYECINMTFEEAYQTMASGEPLAVILMSAAEGCMNHYVTPMFAGNAMTGAPCIGIDTSFAFMGNVVTDGFLYWTADGLSTEMPGGK